MSEVLEVFDVYSKGHIMSGYVTFWRTPKAYMYQAVGNPKRCSKKLYEEAKALYEEQQKASSSPTENEP